MTVQCVNCSHFRLRESNLAKNGFGRCALNEAWRSMSATWARDCATFNVASEETIAKRTAWLNQTVGKA